MNRNRGKPTTPFSTGKMPKDWLATEAFTKKKMNSLMRFQGVGVGSIKQPGSLLADAGAMSTLYPKSGSKGRSTLIPGCAYNNYILGVLSKDEHLTGRSSVSLKWEERNTLILIP